MNQPHSDINQRKLLDKLNSPPEFGPLMGLLATTFEMQPEFFETDFLPAVLNLGAWDDRSWTSRIEIERKLACMKSATVIMDASRYRNRPRSLRVNIVPVSLGGGRALHSKIVLLVFEKAVRLLVGSANLTHQGYRENREVAVVLTAHSKKRDQAGLILSALSTLPEIFKTCWNSECDQLKDEASDLLSEWIRPNEDENEWFIWGGGGEPIWKSFISRWPESERIKRVTIVSPFWSDDEKHTSLVTLVKELKGKKILDENFDIRLLTEAAPDTQSSYKPMLPSSFGNFDFRAFGAIVSAQAVDPKVLQEEVGMEGFVRNRSLHAKVVMFEGEATSLAYMGSGNFTRRGWSFLENPLRGNIEAGVVVRRAEKGRKGLSALIPETCGPVLELIGGVTEELSEPESEPETIPWPGFIKEILLTLSPEDTDRLDLLILVTLEEVKGSWEVYISPEKAGDGEDVVFKSPLNDQKREFRVRLGRQQLNRILREQEVIVRWWDSDEGRLYPINVSPEAKHTLPISPGTPNFSEQNLILYYQGRISWEDLFPDPEAERTKEAGSVIVEDDYGRRVDTSGIQSYQVREFVEALKGIIDDLKSASRSTEPAMRLALHGPISPIALARVVTDGALNDQKSSVAAGFQLIEILGCLEVARNYDVSKKCARVWKEFIEEAVESIDLLIEKLHLKSPESFKRRGPFSKYERSIRNYFKSAGIAK
ncbi:MAG: hypothetical protein JRJ86_14265 [Deltaproteobacteria bacterium]|nr:hypothetical protein [Deltaproteobacteria bacterium]MBW2344494.1 hypothetical protein [Deltaproteobacteria bacterium]